MLNYGNQTAMSDTKLIILIDGTCNDKDNKATYPTNVAKLKRCLAEDSKVIFYESGPGTFGGEAVTGGIGLASSMIEHILSPYYWLAKRHSNLSISKNIYLMGFSRGAYIVRSLSWVLYYAGIPKNPNDCKERLRKLYAGKFDELKELKKNDKVILNEGDIKFLGALDTVKSSTLPDVHDEELCPLVEKASHAMALDECRKSFQILKFKPNTRVKQMWFIGCHSDIGGGYKESDLSDITCKWMASEAFQAGLKFKKSEIAKLKPNPLSENIHDEYADSLIWKSLGKVYRVYEAEGIHKSVATRIESLAYSPMCKNYPNSQIT